MALEPLALGNGSVPTSNGRRVTVHKINAGDRRIYRGVCTGKKLTVPYARQPKVSAAEPTTQTDLGTRTNPPALGKIGVPEIVKRPHSLQDSAVGYGNKARRAE